MDTYSMHVGYSVPAVVTGKPVSIGGSEGRAEATGRGCMITAIEAAKHVGLSVDGMTVVVQGFGNVGAVAAQLLQHAGCTVIAVSDSQSGIYNERGIDVDRLAEHKGQTGGVGESDLRKKRASHRSENNSRGCERATTPEADKILGDKGVFVIPDVLANTGGVTVSYFEWVQDLQSFFWKESEVNQRLKEIMTSSFAAVLAIAEKHKTDMRTAAYILAVDRVAEAMLKRGIYP